MQLFNSDCLEVLKSRKSLSVDAIVTDPPYGINVFGNDWDASLPSEEILRECFRVLKPGGHILAFSSVRHYHRLACAMEDAGFETNNMLAWLYGTGFPKGGNLSRYFDRVDGVPVPDDAFRAYLREAIEKSPYAIKDIEEMCGTKNMFTHYLGKSQAQYPTPRKWKIIKEALGLDDSYDALFERIERQKGKCRSGEEESSSKTNPFRSLSRKFRRHQPRCRLAKKWEGWRVGKTSLRCCMEPIYLGQKPPLRPVTENVKRYGVGALNVEGCRFFDRNGQSRYPGNVMHDGSSEVVRALNRDSDIGSSSLGEFNSEAPFFFISKPSSVERKGNPHPTLKPLSLMRTLVRLVVPQGAMCLDPFMGSGTTGVACILEGVDFVGIEREQEYFCVAEKRLKQATGEVVNVSSF